MKKFIIQALAILIVVFGALAYNTGKLPNFNLANRPKESQILINDLKIKVETADSANKRKKGLGGRENLAADSGMLFSFPKPDYYNFWMKDMKFGLDLIWIKDKKVIDMNKNIPPQVSGQPDESLPIYTPNQPVDSVLEVNSGFADSHNIKVGDSIEIR